MQTNQKSNKKWIEESLMYEGTSNYQTIFTDSISGKLSLEQIINGEYTLIWEEESPVKLPEKKTIVITSWFYANNLGMPNDTLALYQSLLKAGFRIVVANKDQLITVHNEHTLQQALKSITPIKKTKLENELKKYGIAHDAHYLADIAGEARLIQSLNSRTALLNISWNDLKNIPETYRNDLLQSTPALATMIFILDKNDFKQNNKGWPKIWMKEFSHISFTSDLKNTIQWTDIQKICLNFQTLKTLDLSNCEYLGNLAENISLPPSLESLDLTSTDITLEDLQILFQYCKSLKTLTLNRCNHLGMLPNNFVLPPTIEELHLTGINITWQVLSEICQNCTTLKTINLSNCNNLGSLPENFALASSVETLHLIGTNITWQDIQKICQNCTTLKTLNLKDCKNIDKLSKNFLFPSSLESLNLSSTNVTLQDVQTVCQNCTTLKTLNLKGCKNIGKLPKNFSFPSSLESLNLSLTDVDWEDIQTLCQHCYALKTLNVQGCNMLGKLISNFTLPDTLQTLDLSSTDVTWQEVQTLCQNCRSMKTLDLSCCNRLGKIINDLNLPPTLETLDLSFTAITWQQIQVLCQKCPDLKTIYVERCTNLGKIPENLNLPPTLKISYDRDTLPLSSTALIDPIITQSSFHSPNVLELDDDTGYSNNTIDTRILFKPKKNNPKDPSSYRLDIYTQIDEKSKKLSKNPKKIIEVIKENYQSGNDVEEVYEKTKDNPNCFLGQITFNHSVDDWIALPSLTIADKIDASQIQLNPPITFSLGYCSDEALYYIKPNQPLTSEVNIKFIVETKNSTNTLPNSELNQETIRMNLCHLQFDEEGNLPLPEIYKDLSKQELCQILISYCSGFSEKKISTKKVKGLKLVNEVMREQAGHCRHRAQVFVAMAKAWDIPCRYIRNDCHAYVEILDAEKNWLGIDLGGTEANINTLKYEYPMNESSSIPTIDILSHTIDDILKTSYDDTNPFFTWDTHPSQAKNLSQYAKELLKLGKKLPEGKRNLLCLLNRDQIDGLHETLLNQTKNKNKMFYIDNLNHVPEHQIIVEENGQYIKKDSALMLFLKQAQPGDVLLVNWSDYESRHVGFNTLIDKDRKLKDVLIDKGVTIINLLSHDKKAEMGEDFYSRCRAVSSMPPSLTANPISIESSEIINTKEMSKEICFYDNDWQSCMKGSLQLTPNGYAFSTAPFIQALLEKKNPLILRNAPWHLPSFRAFIRTLQADEEITVNGAVYSLKNVKFYRDDTPYNLVNAPITLVDSLPSEEEQVFILNRQTFNSFFQQYSTQNGQLVPTKGWLAQYQNKTLSLLLTSPLSNGQWEKLRLHAQQHGVQINLSVSPGIEIPKAFGSTKRISPVKSTQVILQHTNDIGYVLEKAVEDKNKVIIHINEKTTLADLIERTVCIDNGNERYYQNQPSALSHALLQGKEVILAGNTSKTLMEGLASLFLPKPYLIFNGTYFSFTGRLTLITENSESLDFVSPQTEMVSDEARWQALSQKYPLGTIDRLKKTCHAFTQATKSPPFNTRQVDSMLTRLKWKPHANPIKALLRLHPEFETFKTHAENAWQLFKMKDEKKSRYDKVMAELMYSPYVFLAGPSGVGKSHFVRYELGQSFEVLTGLKKLEDFLKPGDKPKCLFIDEANLLDPETMEVFRGLFNTPPQLLIKGKFFPIPQNHKLVFAGNPGHFQGRRDIALFKEHGHIITFKPLSKEILYQDILKPITNILFPQSTSLTPMHNIFIKVFEEYGDRLSLTTRNLEMMALRSKGFQIENMQEIACLCAYDEIAPMLNKSERKAFRLWCQTEFKLNVNFLKKTKQQFKDNITTNDKFFLTKSRKNPLRLLDNLMIIREEKIKNKALEKKGISAILLEGEAGIGKSLLAMNYLESKGFMNGEDQKHAEKKYYHLTPSAGFEVIKTTLLKAFHEGSIVIIDELNTLPLEELLNNYLSGVDEHGNVAENKGFTLIATQNPITFAKRQSLSPALLNRFQKINLKNYPTEELIDIMTHLSDDSEFAKKSVEQFNTALSIANDREFHPKPTARHLFHEGEQHKINKIK